MEMGPMLNEPGFVLVNKLMDLSTRQQSALANNLANADTPGYVRRELDFQSQLAECLKAGDTQGVADLKGELVEDTSGPARIDGNNVNLPNEMAEMAQNGVLHQLLGRVYNTRVRILKDAIKGAA